MYIFKGFLHCFGTTDLIKCSKKCFVCRGDSVKCQKVCNGIWQRSNTGTTRFLKSKRNISLTGFFGWRMTHGLLWIVLSGGVSMFPPNIILGKVREGGRLMR